MYIFSFLLAIVWLKKTESYRWNNTISNIKIIELKFNK